MLGWVDEWQGPYHLAVLLYQDFFIVKHLESIYVYI